MREELTFDFRGAHQGVYRTIPIRYDRHGLDFALRVDDVGVYDQHGSPLRTEVSYPGRAVTIKAWVPGAVDARRTVVFVYRVRRGLLSFDQHDELYWNVTGNEWAVPIHRAEAIVNIPAGVDPALLRTAAFTGPAGASGQDFTLERIESYLAFRTRRALRPGEGLTIVVGWPAGAVARPSALRQAVWFAQDNWPLTLPVLTAGLLGLVWHALGRDPGPRRSVKPEYEPPAGITPAEAGALVDEAAEPRDVIATLIDLAVRGYVHIEQVTTAFGDGDFLFKRLKPVAGDPALKPLELYVLGRLFGSDWNLNLRLLSEVRRDYDNVFPPIRDAIYRTMVEDRLFPVSPGGVRRGWVVAGVLLLLASVALVTASPQWAGRYGFVLPLGVFVSGLVVIAFSRIMPRRTRRGVRVLAQVRGFQEFLERAEKDRLERLPADTLHRWLPWAIALGVTGRWIVNFEGLKVDAPGWLSTSTPFSLASFEHEVTRFEQKTAEAILTARRGGDGDGGSGSSGFSGGSSGGGSGGGGGGTF